MSAKVGQPKSISKQTETLEKKVRFTDNQIVEFRKDDPPPYISRPDAEITESIKKSDEEAIGALLKHLRGGEDKSEPNEDPLAQINEMVKGLFAKIRGVSTPLKPLPFVNHVADVLEKANAIAGIPLGNESRLANLEGWFKRNTSPPKSPEEIQEGYDNLVKLLYEKGMTPNALFAIGLTNKRTDEVRCHIKKGGLCIDPESDKKIIEAVKDAGIKIVKRFNGREPDGIEFQLDPNKIVEAWKKQESKIPPDKKAEYEKQTKNLEANLGFRGIKIGEPGPGVTTNVLIGSKGSTKISVNRDELQSKVGETLTKLKISKRDEAKSVKPPTQTRIGEVTGQKLKTKGL